MKKNWLFPLMALALSACVTINIYFPAAAAEKAADRIIDEIMQKKDATSVDSKPTDSAPKTAPGDKK